MQAERRREIAAGSVMALLGLGAAVKGSSYSVGTLADMGPGLFPMMVGGALVVVGGLIALSSSAPGSGPVPSTAHGAVVPFDPRVWVCVLGGAALFIVLAAYAGLLPAIFLSVLVTAWADRTTTWRGSLILAACVSAFGVALFTYVLHVQIPVLQGF